MAKGKKIKSIQDARAVLVDHWKNPVVTLGHKRLAKATAEFGGVPGVTKKKLLKIAGFSEKNHQVFHTRGYHEALKDYGLTESLVAEALVSDIKQKPRNRYHELALAADILGMRKKGDNIDNSRNMILMVSGETAQRYGALPKPVQPIIEDAPDTGTEV